MVVASYLAFSHGMTPVPWWSGCLYMSWIQSAWTPIQLPTGAGCVAPHVDV